MKGTSNNGPLSFHIFTQYVENIYTKFTFNFCSTQTGGTHIIIWQLNKTKTYFIKTIDSNINHSFE